MRVEEELTEEELQELQKAEEQAEVEDKELDEEALAEEQLPIAVRRYGDVAQAVTTLAKGGDLDADQLTDLSDEERAALEDLITVMRGSNRGHYVFAEDRLDLLNHSLAVLQPIFAIATAGTSVDALRASFEEVVDDLNELRDRLQSLDDAEDLQMRDEFKKRGEDEDDEDDDDDDEDDDDDGDEAGGEAPAAEATTPATTAAAAAGAAAPATDVKEPGA